MYNSTLFLKYLFDIAWFICIFEIYVSISCLFSELLMLFGSIWKSYVIRMSSTWSIYCILWCDVCDCRLLQSISIKWRIVLVDAGHCESLQVIFGCITWVSSAKVVCWYKKFIFEWCLLCVGWLPAFLVGITVSVLHCRQCQYCADVLSDNICSFLLVLPSVCAL